MLKHFVMGAAALTMLAGIASAAATDKLSGYWSKNGQLTSIGNLAISRYDGNVTGTIDGQKFEGQVSPDGTIVADVGNSSYTFKPVAGTNALYAQHHLNGELVGVALLEPGKTATDPAAAAH